MIAPLRRRTVVGGLLAVALTVTGCAHTGQVAAKVGSTTVSSGELADFTVAAQHDAGLAGDPATVTAWQRKVLGYLVQRDLWRTIAAKEGLVVTPADVDAKLTEIADANGGMAAIDTALAGENLTEATFRPVLEALAIQDKFVEHAVQPSDADIQSAYDASIANYRTVTVKHVAVTTKELADKLVAQITADPASFDTVAQANGATDPATLASVIAPLSKFGPMGDAVWATPDGSVIDGQLGDSTWHVFLVQGHATKPLADARPAVLAGIRSGQRTAVISALLEKDKPAVGIEINPRFGAWDPAAQAGATVSEIISDTVLRGPAAPSVDLGTPAAPGPTDTPTPTDSGAAG